MSALRGRPPGYPKTGGRSQGTPNRDTSVLREKLEALGCDPIAELVRIAKDPTTESSLRVSIYSLLIRHTSPVPRPVDVGAGVDSTVDDTKVTPEQALRWATLVMETFGPNSEEHKVDTEKAQDLEKPKDKEPDEH